MKEKENKKRILVTGANGFLGVRVVKFFKGSYEVIACNRKELDFTDSSLVRRTFETHRPHLIIHCGAISDVGACEKEPEYSYKVNVEGSKIIAEESARIHAKMIFCSSDQVYFGSKKLSPHLESENVTPPHPYGQQKLEAERLCLMANSNTIALRLSWMYDWEKESAKEHGNLITAIQEALNEHAPINYPIHDFRSITNVWEVIKNMEKVFEIPPGIYNFGSPNDCSTYEIAKLVLLEMGEQAERIQKNENAFMEFPRNLRMDQKKINKAGIYFANTAEGIRRV